MKIGDFIEVRELTPEEATEYRAMEPGITQTKDMIRMVAVEDGQMSVIEQTADGISRIRVRMK